MQINCNYDVTERCGNCNYVRDGNEALVSYDEMQRVCSSLFVNANDCFGETCENELALTNCYKKCMQMCGKLIYHYSVIQTEENNTTKVKFTATFMEDGILIFEEVPSYSLQSAVSNIGGQLGLWFGIVS